MLLANIPPGHSFCFGFMTIVNQVAPLPGRYCVGTFANPRKYTPNSAGIDGGPASGTPATRGVAGISMFTLIDPLDKATSQQEEQVVLTCGMTPTEETLAATLTGGIFTPRFLNNDGSTLIFELIYSAA